MNELSTQYCVEDNSECKEVTFTLEDLPPHLAVEIETYVRTRTNAYVKIILNPMRYLVNCHPKYLERFYF